MSARKPRETRAPWVTMGPDPWFATCQRCGTHERQPELPLPIPAFVAYADFVIAKHEGCVSSQEADK